MNAGATEADQLPKTGDVNWWLAGAGFALIGGGAGILVATRKRKTP